MSSINNKYLSEKTKTNLRKKFISAIPFPYLELNNFFDKNKLMKIKKELLKEKFIHKECDLFNLYQTNDLSSTKNNTLKGFYSFFESEQFKRYIFSITGIKISKKIDMAGMLFKETGYLLPHDDRLSGRKIAYVVNLSEEFSKKDGGSLDLFEVKKKSPTKITKTILPKFNTLVLFEVSPTSFHQVSENISNKKRLSIGGWFHG